MYKRGLAFLLAAVLAFSPVMQVSAAEVSVQEMQVETPETVEEIKETPSPEVIASAQPEETTETVPEETQAPEALDTPDVQETPGETPETSAAPEEMPEETEAPEVPTQTPEVAPEAGEGPSAGQEEGATPEESMMPEETPSAEAEESATPEASIEPSESPEAEESLEIDTELVTLITEDITISADTADTSGEGWTWVKDTKTFTMNGLQLQGQLTLPDGAVIVLAKGSENSIDNTNKYSRFNINALGDLSVKGSGKLTIIHKNYGAVYVKGNIVFEETNVHFVNNATSSDVTFHDGGGTVRFVCSNIKIESVKKRNISKSIVSCEGCTFTGGDASSSDYACRLNEETGLYEMSFAPSAIYITKQPEKINKLYVGESVDLSLAAESGTGEAITYQWYTTEDLDDPDNGAVKVKNTTGKTLTVNAKSHGITYYYCKVSTKNTSFNSDVVAVVASEHKGLKICTEKPSFTTTQDKLDTEGWKYDSDTHTLTIENMDMLLPFQNNFTNVQIKSGYNVVINGTNYMVDNDGKFSITKSGKVGNVTTFSGSGCLYTNEIGCLYLEDTSEVHYTGGVTLYLDELSPDHGISVVDGATVKTRMMNIFNGSLVLQNRAYFESTGDMEVMADLTVEEGCQLVCGSYLRCNGNMSIGKDAVVIIEKYLDMDATSGTGVNKSRVLTIDGTLWVKAKGSTYNVSIYTQVSNPVVLGTGVKHLVPDTFIYLEKTNSYYYKFKTGNTTAFELVIGTETIDSKTITASKEVTGSPKYDKVLTAGEVTPADASVSYQWQYAKSANGPWSNTIYGGKSNTYTVESMYHGYYLRVVTKGIGNYTGEIMSDPVGPVVGNPTYLSGIWYEGGTGGVKEVGGNPFVQDNTKFYTTSDANSEGKVSYVVTTVSEDAKVTFRNVTADPGFKKTGKSATIPVVPGENTIEIEVNYGGETHVYTIFHTIEQIMYELDLDVPIYCEDSYLMATWKDEEGQIRTFTVDENNSWDSIELPAGTEVTITSYLSPVEYPIRYNGISVKPDLKKDGYPATFTLNEDTYIYIWYDDTMACPPEDLTARWTHAKSSIEASVKAMPAYGGMSGDYEVIEIAVYDSAGQEVDNETIGGSEEPDADGYYRVSFDGLDDSKVYTVKAHYFYLCNSNQSMEEQSASYTLKKREPITISTASSHVVLKPGESIDVPIIYNGFAGSIVKLESGFDTKVVSEGGTFVKKDSEGNRSLQITAHAQGEGTTYVTVRGQDYDDGTGMQYVYTSVRVDVSSTDEASKLNLGVKKGTLNLYDDSTLTIPVYQMECGHEIESAAFTSAALNEKFAIEVVNDRKIKVIPKVPVDDGTIDFAKWVKERGRTGTFSSKIVVNYNGTASRISNEKLTITLKAKKPETKVSALSFNSFYTKQDKNLKVTVKGEKIAKVQVDTVKTKGKTVACPDWLSYNEAYKSVEFNGNTVPANKTTGYLYLKIWPEGYRMPIQTKVKVNVNYTAPKLKFKKSTITVLKDIAENPYFENTLVSADSKVKYANIGVESLKLMSYTDYLKLSEKKRKEHVNPLIFNTNDDYYFSPSTGLREFEFQELPQSGKVVLYAHIANGKKPVKVSFNLKAQASPTLKVNKKSVTLDAVLGSYSVQNVKLTSSANGYVFNRDDISYKVTMVGDKKKTDYSSHLGLSWDSDKKAIRVSGTTSMKPGKTYKVVVSVTGMKKTASFEVKVVKSKTPAFQVSQEEITLNRMSAYKTKKVTISLPKKFGTNWYTTMTQMVVPEGTSGSMGVNFDGNPASCGVSFYATENTVPGTYIYKVYGGLYGNGFNGAPGHEDDAVKHAEIKIKVVDKFPSVTVDKTMVTLNKDLAALDKAVVNLTVDDSYKYAADEPWSLVSIKDAAGNDVDGQLNCSISGTKLIIESTDATVYGATYQVRLACAYAYDVVKADTVVTVKVAPEASKISFKGKAQGSIDITRPATSAKIKYTYTNWNVAEYAASEIPVLEWEVYAKNGKKNVKMTDGALSDKGLVAKGSSASDTPTEAGSWFKDVSAGYDMALGINADSAAWRAGDILPGYTYTVKATLKFPNTGEEIKASAVTFKVKQGTVKYAMSPKKATLNKLDPKGRSIFTIKDKNKYWYDVAKIAKVEVVADKNVPVSKKIEVVPVYGMNQKTSYAVYWKDKKAANVKSGTVKVNIYLEGNDPARKKPNASFKLKVNVK